MGLAVQQSTVLLDLMGFEVHHSRWLLPQKLGCHLAECRPGTSICRPCPWPCWQSPRLDFAVGLALSLAMRAGVGLLMGLFVGFLVGPAVRFLAGLPMGLAVGLALDGNDVACPFCRIPTLNDQEGLIAYRGKTAYVVMNLYPYNPGHLLI